MSFLKEYIGELDMNKVDDLENRIETLEKDKQNFPVSILRRDTNDLHTIIMLRGIAKKIKKENIITFIGTGQINENVVHAYLYLCELQRDNKISKHIQLLFVARTQLEYEFIYKFGFGCEMWRYQSPLADKILRAKTVVLSSHLFSDWGNCLLSACTAGADIIQLWHGLPAKSIGASCVDNTMSIHFYAKLMNDISLTDHLCIENANPDVIAEYIRAFPNAKRYVTGSIRMRLIFDEIYRQRFVSNKVNKSIQNWLIQSKNKKKILYCPTYREKKNDIVKLRNNIEDILSLQLKDVVFAVRPHIAVKIDKYFGEKLEKICQKSGNLIIEHYDEVYSSFLDFDAIITDYSSIRVDYAVSGKPIFLWQFDVESYNRVTGVIDLFNQLDKFCYQFTEFDIKEILMLLDQDPKREIRQSFVNTILKPALYEDAEKKVADVILQVFNW